MDRLVPGSEIAREIHRLTEEYRLTGTIVTDKGDYEMSNASALCDEIKADMEAEGVGAAALPKPLLAFLSMALEYFGPQLLAWLKTWIDSQKDNGGVV